MNVMKDDERSPMQGAFSSVAALKAAIKQGIKDAPVGPEKKKPEPTGYYNPTTGELEEA